MTACIAFCLGLFFGKSSVSKSVDSEANVFSDLSFADEKVFSNKLPEKYAEKELPEDLYIRLKNESETLVQKEIKAENKKTDDSSDGKIQTPPEYKVITDKRSEAHREAALGIRALNDENCEGAIMFFENALSLEKNKDFLSHYILSLLSCSKSDKAAAKAVEFEDYLELSSLAGIVEIAVKKGRQAEVIRFYENIGIKNNPRFNNAVGIAYEMSGDLEKAIFLYKKAYSGDPKDPYIVFSMARSADLEGNYPEAFELYEVVASANIPELKRYAVSRSSALREYMTMLSD